MKKLFCVVFSVFISFFLFAEKPIVHDISAYPGNNKKINILWTLPNNPDQKINELLIYRSTKQISSYEQIRNMEPIGHLSGDSFGFTDSVPDHSDYYYAVIAVTSEPYDLILLSYNSTVFGTHLSVKETNKISKKEEKERLYPEGTLREIPLPFLDFQEGEDGQDYVSEKVATNTNSLQNKLTEKNKPLDIYIFEEDLISPDGGDDYLLFNILKTTFIQRKYKEAIKGLEKLTGTNISQNTRNRAYFYLGESYYFLGDYQKAIKAFVRIEDVYPALVQKWLDSSLDRL